MEKQSDLKRCVLVVDDNNAVRATICDNLREAGFEILEASNGSHALAMIERHGYPSVIITDLVMPAMDGFDAIEAVRRQSPHVPIIAISGGGTSENFLEQAERAGADAAFAKPLDMDRLEAAIGRLVA